MNTSSSVRKIIAAIAAVGAGVIMTVSGVATPSHAAHQDGINNNGEMIIYFNSEAYGYGSFSDFWSTASDFAGYVYLSAGAGQGQPVKNNAAHAWNRHDEVAVVYYNSGYDCNVACQSFASKTRADFNPTIKNQNASFKWVF